jgi:hypothetical protein
MSLVTVELLAKLKDWNDAVNAVDTVAKPIIAKEMALRKELFAMAFPSPKEGTNNLDLPNGWKAKGTYKLERKIDESALPAIMDALRKVDVVAESLVRINHDLDTAAYKALSDANQAIFNQCLTIKPASPSFELITPKEPK